MRKFTKEETDAWYEKSSKEEKLLNEYGEAHMNVLTLLTYTPRQLMFLSATINEMIGIMGHTGFNHQDLIEMTEERLIEYAQELGVGHDYRFTDDAKRTQEEINND